MSNSENFFNNVCSLLRSNFFATYSRNLEEEFNIKKGVCFGLASMWMQAVLCGEVDRFNKLIEMLCADPGVGEGKKILISPEVLTFIRGILIYQYSREALEHGRFLTNQSVSKSSPHAVPPKLAIPDGNGSNMPLCCVYNSIMAGNQVNYQFALPDLLRTMQSKYDQFVIMLAALKHRIALTFEYDEYIVFDQNILDEDVSGSITTKSPQKLVANIFDSFGQQENLVCHIEAYVAPQKHLMPSEMTTDEGLYLPQYCNNDYTDLFYMAIRVGKPKLVRAILNINSLNSGFINQLNDLGMSPLYLACYWGQIQVVRTLLENNADPDGPHTSGAVALFIAAFNGYHNIVRLLLEYKADPKKVTSNFNIILQKYIAGKYPQIMKTLQDSTNKRKRESVSSDYCNISSSVQLPQRKLTRLEKIVKEAQRLSNIP